MRIKDGFFIGLLILVCISWFWSCAPVQRTAFRETGPVSAPEFNYIDRADEISYGDEMIPEIVKDLDLFSDEHLQAYIQNIGDRITNGRRSVDQNKEYIWSFELVDSSVINAFAVLGGHVFIHRGLVEKAESESELAGILALEASHLLAGNIQEILYERIVRQSGFDPGEIISGTEGWNRLEEAINREGGALAFFSSLEFTASQVKVADRMAVEMITNAGFNPSSYLNIVSRLGYERRVHDLWIKRTGWNENRRNYLRDMVRFKQSFSEDTSRFEVFKRYLASVSTPSEMDILEEVSEAAEDTVLKLKVLGIADWTDTGLDVYEGQQVTFLASGAISLQKGNPTAYSRPDGLTLKTFQQPIPGENFGALIGKVVQLVSIEIDEETGKEKREEIIKMFYIGGENTVQMPIAGRLFLGINEDVLGDNSGEYLVEIVLNR
ncbi:MAG: M48 family metalloprotease [Candidatus Aminicenantes bacterium]|nr:M48 family metalloprotease [Candidatus Aminicenantes bacterium]